jgi:hypothetical protein
LKFLERKKARVGFSFSRPFFFFGGFLFTIFQQQNEMPPRKKTEQELNRLFKPDQLKLLSLEQIEQICTQSGSPFIDLSFPATNALSTNPSLIARSTRSCFASIPISFLAPRAREICSAARPTGPSPTTRTASFPEIPILSSPS